MHTRGVMMWDVRLQTAQLALAVALGGEDGQRRHELLCRAGSSVCERVTARVCANVATNGEAVLLALAGVEELCDALEDEALVRAAVVGAGCGQRGRRLCVRARDSLLREHVELAKEPPQLHVRDCVVGKKSCEHVCSRCG